MQELDAQRRDDLINHVQVWACPRVHTVPPCRRRCIGTVHRCAVSGAWSQHESNTPARCQRGMPAAALVQEARNMYKYCCGLMEQYRKDT